MPRFDIEWIDRVRLRRLRQVVNQIPFDNLFKLLTASTVSPRADYVAIFYELLQTISFHQFSLNEDRNFLFHLTRAVVEQNRFVLIMILWKKRVLIDRDLEMVARHAARRGKTDVVAAFVAEPSIRTAICWGRVMSAAVLRECDENWKHDIYSENEIIDNFFGYHYQIPVPSGVLEIIIPHLRPREDSLWWQTINAASMYPAVLQKIALSRQYSPCWDGLLSPLRNRSDSPAVLQRARAAALLMTVLAPTWICRSSEPGSRAPAIAAGYCLFWAHYYAAWCESLELPRLPMELWDFIAEILYYRRSVSSRYLLKNHPWCNTFTDQVMPLANTQRLPNFHHDRYCKDLSFYVPLPTKEDDTDDYAGMMHGYHDWYFDHDDDDDDMPGLE